MKQKKSILNKNAPRETTVDLHGIPVTVTRKSMKTLRLRVRASDRSVHLSVPTHLTDERAMLFLSSKEEWIRKVLAELQTESPAEARRHESGAPFDLWGKRYTLLVTEDARGYSLSFSEEDHIAHISVPPHSAAEKIERFLLDYRKEALLAFLSESIPKWEAVTGLKSASHDTRLMKSRWGSCNVKTRHIRLNLRLTEYPKLCTEYVVLHELCHLKIPHHGKDFHALVGSFLPEWKSIRAHLNGKPHK